MGKLIESNFIKFKNHALPPWNERLFTSEVGERPSTINAIQQEYLDKFKLAIAKNEIKLEDRRTCYCGNNQLERISNTDRFGLDFSTYICKDCGLIMTSPFIDEGSLRHYYDTFYHPVHFGIESLEEINVLFRPGQGEKIYNKIQGFLTDRSGLRVLEIGVGTGSVLSEFKRAAEKDDLDIEELGTEFNEKCIKKAEDNGLNVIFGAFDEVIAQNKTFDIVILSHVLEHFSNLSDELWKLKKVITDKSLVYTEVPGLMSLHKKSEYTFDYLKYTTHAHVYNFNLSSLTRVFNDSGFELLLGNEEVEAVFKLGIQSVDTSKNYDQLIGYLSFLEQNRLHIFNKHKMLIDQGHRLEQMEHQQEQAEHQLELVEHQLKQKNNQIHKILNSWSWKMSAPLRWIGKTILPLINRITPDKIESTNSEEISPVNTQKNNYTDFIHCVKKHKNVLGRHRLSVQVQTVSACNASCYICPYQESWQKSNPGKMSDEVYQKIIDEVSQYKIQKFCPYLENEPLLDSRIFDRIEYGLSKLDINTLELATNASMLNNRKIDDIVRLFPDVKHQIWISFHGIDKETYKSIMGLNFDATKANIIALVEKAQTHNLNILIRGAGLPRLQKGKKPGWFTEEQYMRFWNKEFEKHGFKKLPNVGFFTYHDRAGQISRNEINFSMTVRPDLKDFYCVRFDQWIHFLYTGELILCCMDYHRNTVFGDITKKNLNEIYISDTYMNLARQVSGLTQSPDNFICKKCASPGG